MSNFPTREDLEMAVDAAIHEKLLPVSEFADSPEFRGWKRDISKTALDALLARLPEFRFDGYVSHTVEALEYYKLLLSYRR